MVRTVAKSSLKGNREPAKRAATPPYCTEQLGDALKKVVVREGIAKAFDLGEYLHVPLTHAVRGKALLGVEELITALLGVTPFALIKYKDLKDKLRFLLQVYPDLKGKKDTSDGWCSDIACQINVVLAHLRRLKDSCKWRQCIQNLTNEEAEKLKVLVDAVEPLISGGSHSSGVVPSSGGSECFGNAGGAKSCNEGSVAGKHEITDGSAAQQHGEVFQETFF